MTKPVYALTLAAVRKFKPCANDLARVEELLPKRGKIDAAQAQRITSPGKHKVYREGGKIYLEVFHNEP